MHILETVISEQYSLLLTQLPEVSSMWLEQTNQLLIDLTKTQANKEKLATAWANASAQVGSQLDGINIPACVPELQTTNWTEVELVRLQLVANMLQVLVEPKRQGFLAQCLRYADDDEKQAIGKGLCLLDPEGYCRDLIVNLCRTNNRDLFAAITTGNAWPAKHFSDEEFEAMLLKALFLGLDINLIIGIKYRHSKRMSQLAFDYLSELALAHREWPPSIYISIKASDLTTEQMRRLVSLPEQIKASLYNATTTH